MAEPFLGSLMLTPYNFAPNGYAFCNGQTLAINQNQALFALLGTTYGGNGINTFNLPDLRSRVPVHSGAGVNLGQVLGEEQHTLVLSEMPSHTHAPSASNAGTASQASPVGNAVGPGASGQLPYASTSGATMAAGALTSVGNNQAHENRQPYLVLNWVIALTGIFPSRN